MAIGDVKQVGWQFLVSPAFSGDPKFTVTPTAGDKDQTLANTEFVNNAVTAIQSSMVTGLNLKADKASPYLTGAPSAASPPVSANGLEIATAGWTNTAASAIALAAVAGVDLSAKANVASPTFTGVPAAPTASAGTNTTQVATTAFVYLTVAQGIPEVSLASSGTISWNWATQSNAKINLTGTATLSVPTSAVAGQFASVRIAQDGTGGRSVTFNAAYKGMTEFSLSTASSEVDWLLFRAVSSSEVELVGFRNSIRS